MPKIQYEIQRGYTVSHGDMHVTPLAKTFTIPIPAILGGLVWNRPYAVEVRMDGGEAWTLPVQDVTRQAQIALLVMGLIGVLLIGLVARKK